MKLTDKVREENIKSNKLRKLASQVNNMEKAKELRKQQDEAYKKFLFFKNLNNVKNKNKK